MATATSRYAVPVVAMQNLLAASSNFVSAVGATSYATAKTKVHFCEAYDQADPDNPGHVVQPRPRAIIYLDKYPRNREGPGTWIGEGQVVVVLELIPPPDIWPGPGAPHDWNAEFIWFANLVGAIESDLESNSGLSNANGDAYLNANVIDVLFGPAPCDDREETQSFWVIEWMVRYR